ncbi:secreted RxLR effector protein 161-like [Telopea speciosissima]|uniref:secreted RxLR effector protein 161-like n=1 Tax=Telopea speciosissima TaxID=54955 RepID=UPI001CC4CB87|nr:secreted RxLR effector protein 161-like [Telopea speciosissima]
MSYTRPDIAFTVGILSRFTSNLDKEHWDALTRLMRYLKGTLRYVLHYTGHPPILEIYSDALWCSNLGDSKCTSGYVFTMGGATVAWKSKRQNCIVLSSMKSELVALASAGDEVEWIKDLDDEDGGERLNMELDDDDLLDE